MNSLDNEPFRSAALFLSSADSRSNQQLKDAMNPTSSSTVLWRETCPVPGGGVMETVIGVLPSKEEAEKVVHEFEMLGIARPDIKVVPAGTLREIDASSRHPGGQQCLILAEDIFGRESSVRSGAIPWRRDWVLCAEL